MKMKWFDQEQAKKKYGIEIKRTNSSCGEVLVIWIKIVIGIQVEHCNPYRKTIENAIKGVSDY